MIFWIVAAFMTLTAIGSALWPMLRRQEAEPSNTQANEGTRLVLIDQLEEIKRDGDRGLINKDEEASARAEIARRLLALDREMAPANSSATTGNKSVYPWAVIVLIPLATISFYYLSATAYHTKPKVASQESSSPSDNEIPGQDDILALVAQVEAHLENNPNDQRGWQTIAPVYLRQGRLDKAEVAYRKALSLGGEDISATGIMQNGLARVLTQKNEGQVSDEALAFFREAQKNEPRDSTGFFFEAIALSQAKKNEQAVGAWENLIAKFGDTNPPWLHVAEQALVTLKAEIATDQAPANELPKSSPPSGDGNSLREKVE